MRYKTCLFFLIAILTSLPVYSNLLDDILGGSQSQSQSQSTSSIPASVNKSLQVLKSTILPREGIQNAQLEVVKVAQASSSSRYRTLYLVACRVRDSSGRDLANIAYLTDGDWIYSGEVYNMITGRDELASFKKEAFRILNVELSKENLLFSRGNNPTIEYVIYTDFTCSSYRESFFNLEKELGTLPINVYLKHSPTSDRAYRLAKLYIYACQAKAPAYRAACKVYRWAGSGYSINKIADKLEDWVEDNGGDGDKFEDLVEGEGGFFAVENKADEIIKKDISEAQSLGIQKIPTIIINDKIYSQPSQQQIKQALENEMRWRR